MQFSNRMSGFFQIANFPTNQFPAHSYFLRPNTSYLDLAELYTKEICLHGLFFLRRSNRLIPICDECRKMLYKLPGHMGSVNEVDFHRLEPIVMSVGSDKQIYLGEFEPWIPRQKWRTTAAAANWNVIIEFFVSSNCVANKYNGERLITELSPFFRLKNVVEKCSFCSDLVVKDSCIWYENPFLYFLGGDMEVFFQL